jgi:ABC-type glycerol-3-phosphate transport system substrate-binding protein
MRRQTAMNPPRISRRSVLAAGAAAALGAVCGSCSRRSARSPNHLEFWTFHGAGGASAATQLYWENVASALVQRHRDADISVISKIPHDYYMSVLGTRFIGKNAPDVMVLDDSSVFELAEEGLLLPLDDFIRGDPTYRNDDMVPSMVGAAHINGKQYSVPQSGSAVDLVYRSDLFASAKISGPQTWQDVLGACASLQSQGISYPLTLDPLEPFWVINFVWQNGGQVLSDDNRTIMLSTPEAIGGLQFLHDLIHKYKVIDPATVRGTTPRELWGSNSAAMLMDGSWMLDRYDELFPHLAGKWDVVPLPAGRVARSFFGGQHLAMKRDCRAPQLAWDFVALAVSQPWQMRFTKMTASTPANVKTFDLPEFRREFPHFGFIRSAAFNGRNTPVITCFRKIWYDVFKNSVLDVVMPNPTADVPKTIAAAVPAMQGIVDDYWQQRA